MSGEPLAEEAHRLAIKHDPRRAGLHYEEVRRLQDRGVIIAPRNPGRTVFTPLSRADNLFESVSSGTFRCK